MQVSRLLPAGFLALILAGTGGMIATAQTAPAEAERPSAGQQVRHAHFRGGDHGHHGPRGGFGGDDMFRPLFDTVDADGDRTVTQEEIDTYRASRLAEVDASGDGALSIEEFDTLYREFTRPRMVDAFQELDADGDGVISPEEMDIRVSRLVERLDRDGDGQLTLQRPGSDD